MKAPTLSLSGIGKVYVRKGRTLVGARIAAISNVNLNVRAGEFLAVVGPSGAGKSTLARLMVGLSRPSTGTVAFKGRTLESRADRKAIRGARQIVFQNPYRSLSPRLTVSQIVAEPALIIGRDVEPGKLLAAVGLGPDIAGRLPGNLSAGERQRVALARALATDPELLVLDEPTASLDPISAGGLNRLISGMKGRRSIVVVSHEPAILKEADRIVIVKDGEVAGIETSARVVDRRDLVELILKQ